MLCYVLNNISEKADTDYSMGCLCVKKTHYVSSFQYYFPLWWQVKGTALA